MKVQVVVANHLVNVNVYEVDVPAHLVDEVREVLEHTGFKGDLDERLLSLPGRVVQIDQYIAGDVEGSATVEIVEVWE